jgi:flavin reductase (DIM6/NTAB) family NADH-FMN oxidoreductase RutF
MPPRSGAISQEVEMSVSRSGQSELLGHSGRGRLSRRPAAKKLRELAGHFATGVAVITTRDARDKYYGLTVNAVTSLSLEPPLYLICLDQASNTLSPILQSRVFGLSFLQEGQRPVSNLFAGKRENKFDEVAYTLGHMGVPLIEGALATAVCGLEQTFPGGDHTIVIGHIEDYNIAGGRPLIFYQGQYLEGVS